MRDIIQHNKKSQESGRQQPLLRFIAMAICIAYIAVFLLGAAYLLTHINHEHDHDGPNGSCVTCAHITAVGDLLQQLSVTAPGTVFVFGSMFLVRSFYNTAFVWGNPDTLVKLKVRLNH